MMPTWTSDTYLVSARNGPNSWVVDVAPGEVAIWPSYALRVAEPAQAHRERKTGQRVDLVVEGQKRLEARNISEAEQAAALAAPARPRRERAERVDYSALASGRGRVAKSAEAPHIEEMPAAVELVAERAPTRAKTARAAKSAEPAEPRRSTRTTRGKAPERVRG